MRNITMRNTFRYISAILTAALVSGSAMTAWAQKTYTDEEKAAIKTKKQVIDNGDGSYQLKLETFVTGETSNLYQKTTINSKPMDIVLVLDVSGSMSETINSPADTSARGSQAYTYNGYGTSQYYYKDTDNKYYPVTRNSYNTKGYRDLTSKSYSYSDYGDNKYYYKHDDNYYLVEREFDWPGGLKRAYRRLKFNVNGTTWYLSGTSATTDAPTNVTKDNSTIWTGVLYEESTIPNYVLQYTKNGTTYYLSGTTSSTTQTGVTGNSEAIWTGVLYEISAAGKISKMAALQRAVNSFIDSVAAKSDATNPNRIAIVKFAGDNNDSVGNNFYSTNNRYNYTQIVQRLSNATLDTKTSIHSTINSLRTGGATAADTGMTHASTLLASLDTNVRKGLVIMFTDGEPNHQSGFDKIVAETTISTSKTLKDKGIVVYTVGTFDKESDDVRTYMNRTSSNYPKATGMDNGEAGTKADDKYYILAQNANSINEAFASITSEIPNGSTGGQGIDLDVEGENAVHLADIVTPSFKVPQGNSSVTLKMQFLDTLDLYHFADTSAFVWRDEVDVPEQVKVSVIENAADTTSTIDITGFDFSTNWVGPIFKKTVNSNNDTTTVYQESTVKHGAKLVIYVDIIPNPEDEGGLVPTNTDKSGVYVGGVLITNDKLQDYITPEPVFTPMDLKIEIEGLGENENAIFNVKGGNLGENGMNIILTSTTDGSVASATIAKVPLRDADGNAITYTVTLDEKWIWAYTAVEAADAPAGDKNYKTGYTVKEHALYNAEVDADGKITNYTTNHIFKFKVAPKEGVSGHGENFKNNEFKIMPKTTSTK